MSVKGKKTKNSDENLIAVAFILIGMSMLIVIAMNSIGIIGDFLKHVIYAIFSKLSYIIAVFLIFLGSYKLLNSDNCSYKQFDSLKFILVSLFLALIYGITNIDIITKTDSLNLTSIKNIILTSGEGAGVGIITHILMFLSLKLIGKNGTAILILALALTIIIKYYKKLLIKTIRKIVLFADFVKQRIALYNNRWALKRKVQNPKSSNEGKKTKNDKKQLEIKPEEQKLSKNIYDESRQKLPAAKTNTAYVPPTLDMLKDYDIDTSLDKKRSLDLADRLEKALDNFGVSAMVENISIGPAITRFELSLKSGTKVNKITSLSEDISLALASKSIRIEAPILGKSLVGIEIPNEKTHMVSFKSVLKTGEKGHKKIAFFIGKDISGSSITVDITEMPHVLIAGSTGSGKSVCINTLICGILYSYSPEEVKLILIDPKVVELSIYNNIPHLVIPVVTDMKKAPTALSWAVAEMEKRYKTFSMTGAKDIDSYNQKSDVKMYRLVIIIDELADMMLVAAKEVEDLICRLAQKARACGIHIVCATQRPSVDVITGLIKANIPTRIAFAVSSQTDSRTILDHSGAEKLLGKGDMLYKPVGMSKPVRIQGAFLTEEEVQNITEFVKENNKVFFDNEQLYQNTKEIENLAQAEETLQEQDEMLGEVIDFIKDKDEISVSLLQRRFKIGFNRASRIMEQMEEKGIVSKSDGSKPRKVIKNGI